MRRNNLSLILPTKRCNSITSSNVSQRRFHHIVQSAQNQSFIENIFDENYLLKRRKSSVQYAKIIVIEYSSNSQRSNEQLIRAGTCLNNSNASYVSYKGDTLIHLSARLGYENILRRLIEETSYATRLTNAKGQTPLLCSIHPSSSSIATFLMEIDPLSITVSDNDYNSVFHYAANLCNDIVLSRALILIKKLNSPHKRIQALSRLIEENNDGKTAFILSIEKGNVQCNRLLLSNENVLNNSIDISLFLNSQSIRCAIDNDRIDILSYWLSDSNRFEIILNINIINSLNALEYSIEQDKIDFIRLFICQNLPSENIFLKKKYKDFLNHFNENDCLTPIQRLLTRNHLVHLVPFLLDQFIIENDGADLSIIDDCLNNSPTKNRCLFGHKNKSWSIQNWLNDHPLTMIARISHNSIDDHSLVRLCVDLKYQLFGNILYFVIACGQIMYVTLYTGVVLASPTPSIHSTNYYSFINNTCNELCFKLSNYKENSLGNDNPILRIFRNFLLILSCLTLFKEGFQLITEKNKYFKKFFINLVEIHMYISGIIYGCDLNECTRLTGIRCHIQWEIGAIGLLSVWTSLLLVLMQGIKFGKHGLLFITVLLNFLKLISYYIFIWIGYYLALYILLKDIFPQFTSFYFIPKLLVMFIGEFDLDSTFFPNNQSMKGSEGALFVYSAFVFTMFIVMSNIMGGLAVADVKEFRLNAKREHLRARIDTILHLQAKFGFICENCSKIVLKLLFNNWSFNKYLFKYNMCQLELKTNNQLNIEISSQIGLFKTISSNKREKINEKYFIYQTNFIIKKQNQLKEFFEDSILRTHNQLKRIELQLHSDIEDLKRHFDHRFLNQ